jgi:hypothetical protein
MATLTVPATGAMRVELSADENSSEISCSVLPAGSPGTNWV